MPFAKEEKEKTEISKPHRLTFVFGRMERLIGSLLLRYAKTEANYKLLRNFFLYGVFGSIAAVLEYVIFILLALSFLRAVPEIANVISAFCGFIFTFTTNTFLNFKKSDRIIKRFISYGLICLFGMSVSTWLIYLLKDRANLFLLKAALILLVAMIQFVLNRYITYRS